MNNAYLENIIFFYILRNIDLLQTYKGDFFTNPVLKQLFEIVKKHILDYHVEPTEIQVINLVKLYGKEDKITDAMIHALWESRNQISQYTEEWLNQNTLAFGEWQNLMQGLRRTIEYVKTVSTDITYENCNDIVQKAKELFQHGTNFTVNRSQGHDFFDPINHQQKQLETRTTGYNFFDQCLNGGWANKTLNVLMGPPKVGKSMFLCNLAANSVKAGENSAYITLEMSYQLVSQRIGSNIFNIPIEQYDAASKDLNYMQAKMKDYYQGSLIEPGKFIIEEFPTSSATVYDIETFLLKTEEDLSTDEKPFKFKNIFIDYINIMKDAKNPNSENMYLKIKSICEDVRAMAQRNNWCVVSLTQTNRSAYESSDIGMSSVSESGGLIATVDSLFGIIQSPTMRVTDTYYIKAVAIRNSGHMGDKKKYNFVSNYLRIDEDLTEEIIPENISLETLIKKGQGNTNNQSYVNNTVQQTPATQVFQPQLGLTDMQITGKDLFNM